VPDGTYYVLVEGPRNVRESNPNKDNNDAALKIRLQGDEATVLERLRGDVFHARRRAR
jgi:hypothetical protein